MRSLLVALFVLSASPAFAQGGEELTPPPEVAPAPPVPPPPAPQAFDPERPPDYLQPHHVVVLPDPAEARRAERRAHLLASRERRTALRSERPWRFRVGLYVTGTPRSQNGFGPYDDDARWAYTGVGVSATASRWLDARSRIDLDVGFAQVFGDYYSSGQHGPEGTLGGGLTLHSRGRFRIGGGVAAALVIARELDEATGGHFGWTGFRVAAVGEMGWFNANDRGVSVRLSPTFTWAPYAKGLAPGVVFGVGVEL